MSFTEDLDSRSREWLIDRVIDLELILFSKAEELDGLPFHLSDKERLILAALYRARGRRCDWAYLIECSSTTSWPTLKVHIHHLRKRLPESMVICSDPGRGYWLPNETIAELDTILNGRSSEILHHRLSPVSRASFARVHPARANRSTPGADAPQLKGLNNV